ISPAACMHPEAHIQLWRVTLSPARPGNHGAAAAPAEANMSSQGAAAFSLESSRRPAVPAATEEEKSPAAAA
ncbi:hypothetical protein VIGAN_02185100, partial [Vigna angularis var. angularis]